MAKRVPMEGSLDHRLPSCPGEGQTLPGERKRELEGEHETDRTLPRWATLPPKPARV